MKETMIHFAYPNVNYGEDKKEFLGCGRYAVSENALEGYKLLSKIKVKGEKVSNAALILAHESFDKEIRKRVFHKKDAKRVYVGESFEHWGSLKQWLAEKRDDLPVARDLEKAVNDWHSQAQDADLLWRGSKLDLLRDYHRNNSSDMTELQHDFFEAAEIRQKRNRRLKFSAIAALVILTFASAIGGLWANRAEKKAVLERNNAVQAEIKTKESEKVAIQERDEADKQRVNAELQATALSSENLFASGKEF